MPRQFIVEAEAFAPVADLAQAALKLLKTRSDACAFPLCVPRLCGLGPASRLPVNRPQRIGEKRVKNVGEQQFLVLLLVIHAQLDASQRLRLRIRLKQRSMAASTCSR